MSVMIRKIDPAHMAELNELARHLEQAGLADVVELVADRLFRQRHVVNQPAGVADYAPIDPAVRVTVQALTAAVAAAPDAAGMRLAAHRILDNLTLTGGSLQ